MRFTAPVINPVDGKLSPMFNGGSITKWLEIQDVSTRSLSIPLTGADTGTDMFRVNTTNKKVGVFTSDLTLANAQFQVGQGEALQLGVQATCAFFGSGQSYMVQRDTVNDVEFLTGVDSTGGIFSVTTNHPLQFRWGSGFVGNVNYMTGLVGGELAMRGISNGIGWYNTTDLTTNYEKLSISFGGDEALIYTSKGGTGTQRDIKIGDPTNNLQFDASEGVFKFNSGVAHKVTRVNSSTYTATVNDNSIRVDYTATGSCTINLPSIADCVDGFELRISNTGYGGGSNHITVTPDGSDTIDNSASYQIPAGKGSIIIQADTTNNDWILIATA